MTRRRIFLFVFLLAALGLTLAGPALYRWAVEEQFSTALAKAALAAAQEPGRRVEIAKLPAPGWDRMFVFGPYTPEGTVLKAVRLSGRDGNVQQIGTSDAVNLLILAKNGTAVMSVLFPRWQGDFRAESGGVSYTRDEAVFWVQRVEGRLCLQPAQ